MLSSEHPKKGKLLHIALLHNDSPQDPPGPPRNAFPTNNMESLHLVQSSVLCFRDQQGASLTPSSPEEFTASNITGLSQEVKTHGNRQLGSKGLQVKVNRKPKVVYLLHEPV